MALSFTGTLGLNTSAYCASAQQFGGAGGFVDGYHITGLRFTVAQNVSLTELGWPLFWSNVNGGIKASPVNFGVWNEDGDLLVQAQVAITTPNWSTRIAPTLLTPGQTYTIAAQTSPFTFILNPDVVVRTRNGQYLPKDFTIVGTNTEPTDASELGQGDPDVAEVFRGIFSIKYIVESTVTQDIPPDPVIYAGGKQFLVTIRSSWMPSSVNEWTLQYSQSADGVSWFDWKDLGTFSIYNTTYSHQDLDPFDKPYYRYRYKVASIVEESDWSEVAYPGQVLNYVTSTGADNMLDPGSIPSGSIDPSYLNITELSAISANLGTVTAGLIRGPLIETSATNPRIALQQDVGLTATDAAGNVTFNLDALTGAATFKGSLTGSSFATGTGNPRVVMDSSGIYATNGAGSDIFRLDAGSGSATFRGAVLSGASGIANFIDTITAAQIELSTLAASPNTLLVSGVLAGTIGAGSIMADRLVAQSITAAQIATSTITADLISFRVGGANLLRGSTFLPADGSTWWFSTGGTVLVTDHDTGGAIGDGAWKEINRDAFGGTTEGIIQNYPLVKPSTKYTLSVYAKVVTGVPTIKFGVNWYAVGTIPPVSTVYSTPQAVTSGWARYTFTLTAPSNAYKAEVILINPVLSTTLGMSNPKMEEGDLATQWASAINPTIIDGETITGATIRTSATNPKVQMDSSGLKAYNALGALVVDIPSDGSTVELDGHIAAAGVDLQAANIATIPNDSKVRWLSSTAGGATGIPLQDYAQVYTSDTFAGRDLTAQTSPGTASLGMNVNDFAINRRGYLAINYGSAASPRASIKAGVTAGTGLSLVGNDITLIDSLMRSSFMMNVNRNASSIEVGHLAQQATGAIAVNATVTTAFISTGISTPNDAGTAFAFLRVAGAFSGLAGSQYSWGYTTQIVAGDIQIQFQFRNNSAAAGSAVAFTSTVFVGFV